MKAIDSKSAMVGAVGLNENELVRLLATYKSETDYYRRFDAISRFLVGRPYDEHPLIGGPSANEILKISLDAFDCVTYVETVLAAATSSSVAEFVNEVRKIRYIDGQVDWRRRNHYMTGWAIRNQTRGVLKNVTHGADTVEKHRILSAVAGLPTTSVTFRCFPKRRLPRVEGVIETGDIIMFVSTRPGLDVFHIGLLIKEGSRLLMRHATRAAGRVVEQELTEFLQQNRMSGFILLKPVVRTKDTRVKTNRRLPADQHREQKNHGR